MKTRSLDRALRLGAAFVVVAAALAACDAQRIEKLEEGVSTEADVRKQFGEPAGVAVNPDGSRLLEYPRQPEGWTNYEVVIGADGRMASLRQLLTPASFARIKPGMNKLEVMKILGKVARSTFFELKGEEVWEWRFKDGQLSRLFTVSFDRQGSVLATATIDDPKEALAGGK